MEVRVLSPAPSYFAKSLAGPSPTPFALEGWGVVLATYQTKKEDHRSSYWLLATVPAHYMKPIILDITIPEYKINQAPDNAVIGPELDGLLKQNFMGQKVVIRCIGIQDHPGLNLDELADIVLKTGTDKYNPKRLGVGYDEFVRKGMLVDFYGEQVEVTSDTTIMSQQVWEMYHSAIGDRGFGVRIDLVLIYDRAQVDMVMNMYDHHPSSDGFVFKEPANKPEALLGIIKIR